MIRLLHLAICIVFVSACAPHIEERSDGGRDELVATVPDNISPLPLVGDSQNEIVMTPGMEIIATNDIGTITIRAADALLRSYTWDGSTRSVVMFRRPERWYGSLGIYCGGPSNYWVSHDGITRGVVQEGFQYFESVEDAVRWLDEANAGQVSYSELPADTQVYVVRDDGLVVAWSKYLPRSQLNVDVWQFYINGERPTSFPVSGGSIVVNVSEK